MFLERVLGLEVAYRHLSYDGNILGLTAFERVGVEVLNEADEAEYMILDGRTVLVESDLRSDKKLKGRVRQGKGGTGKTRQRMRLIYEGRQDMPLAKFIKFKFFLEDAS